MTTQKFLSFLDVDKVSLHYLVQSMSCDAFIQAPYVVSIDQWQHFFVPITSNMHELDSPSRLSS